MAYGCFKDFPKRAASHIVSRNKTFSIVKSPKYDSCQRGFA